MSISTPISSSPDYYQQLADARISLLRRFLALTAFLTLAFAGWDYLIDPIHGPTNVPFRLLGFGLTLVLAWKFPRRLDSGRFDASVVAISLAYSVYLIALLSRLHQGLTLGMPCLTVFLTLNCFLLVRSRNAFQLVSVLFAVAGASMLGGLNWLVLASHLIILSMSLASGALLARVFEIRSLRGFDLELALARQATTDSLTELLNRRGLDAHLLAECERSRRYHRPLSILLADIDHFKKVNDLWGHEVGDSVLAQVGQTCLKALRASDILGRWGGEEFLAILPETTPEEALLLGERLRRKVEQTPCMAAGREISVTISIGLGGYDSEQPWEVSYAAVDAALYRAKAAGRNRCST